MTLSAKQELVDKLTTTALTAIYGQRFLDLKEVEDDKEINTAWEYLNSAFYEIITHIGI